MIVRTSWCPEHGWQETALIDADGRRRCPYPVASAPCGRPLFEGSDFDHELWKVRMSWPTPMARGDRDA